MFAEPLLPIATVKCGGGSIENLSHDGRVDLCSCQQNVGWLSMSAAVRSQSALQSESTDLLGCIAITLHKITSRSIPAECHKRRWHNEMRSAQIYPVMNESTLGSVLLNEETIVKRLWSGMICDFAPILLYLWWGFIRWITVLYSMQGISGKDKQIILFYSYAIYEASYTVTTFPWNIKPSDIECEYNALPRCACTC